MRYGDEVTTDYFVVIFALLIDSIFNELLILSLFECDTTGRFQFARYSARHSGGTAEQRPALAATNDAHVCVYHSGPSVLPLLMTRDLFAVVGLLSTARIQPIALQVIKKSSLLVCC